jgi:N-acetylglutamate synthase-like GNAT family acetyltransferase
MPAVRSVPVALTVDPAIDRAASPAAAAATLAVEAERLAALAALAARASAAPPGRSTSPPAGLAVRPGRRTDVPAVARIVRHWARAGENLPRSEAELVAAADAGELAVATRAGLVVACAILAPYDPLLAEIRSVGTDPARRGGGAGSAVVRHLAVTAALRGIRTVFVLTRAPGFFDRLGFVRTTIDTLPDKIRRDCLRCPRIDRCDEIAMVRPLGPAIPAAPAIPAIPASPVASAAAIPGPAPLDAPTTPLAELPA